MTFRVTHRYGGMETSSDLRVVAELLNELRGDPDDEHPDVAIEDTESGWSLSAFASGLVILEKPADRLNQPQHMRLPTLAEVRELFTMLARGEVDSVLGREWNPGYGSR